MSLSPLMQQLKSEVVKVIEDGSKSVWEKKNWMKMKAMDLEEQQVSEAGEPRKEAGEPENGADCEVEGVGAGGCSTL
ncbi:hypothetical protein V6N11_028250 [Hibiscus sabdariffa]|uniref:Uncharacterized protein n=1 Tax=Hibiscus sabdariffa TaxID=183260 RepID=A0ABR1ZZ67_9ROSI